MINEASQNEFLKKSLALSDEERTLEKKYSAISTMRAICFLAGAGLLIVGIADNILFPKIAGVIILLVFMCLIKMHGDVDRKMAVAVSRREAVERYLQRFQEKWREFPENGESFLNPEDTVAADVDLLGADSLFQMVNVCHTDYGKKSLADDMKLNRLSKEELDGRQEAVKELIQDYDFAINFEAAGIRLERCKKKFYPEEFEQYCSEEGSGKLPKWADVVRFLLPIAELAVLVLWVAGKVSYGYPLVGFLILLSFSWLTKGVTDRVILPVYGVSFVVDNYLEMMKLIEEGEFQAKQLCEIREDIAGENGALQAFSALKRVSQAYNISFNPLVHQVLSGLILWDYQLARSVQKWKLRFGDKVAGSFRKIGELEKMESLAVVGRVRESGWAKINDEQGKPLSCQDLYHPLITPDKVQANSVSLEDGITIITGSNMSGKTTFLRTLAMNLALAYMGAPICGKSLEASYMKIFTSMRVKDDVANGISTFYAEILRIKKMAEYRELNQPMLCLVDEIFKGTNSADRIVGAQEVITRLAGHNCMMVVSTHDFELCEVKDKKGNQAVNYHFEEYYEKDELKFDYKIKDGRCTTTNARAILRMAGFPILDEK